MPRGTKVKPEPLGANMPSATNAQSEVLSDETMQDASRGYGPNLGNSGELSLYDS